MHWIWFCINCYASNLIFLGHFYAVTLIFRPFFMSWKHYLIFLIFFFRIGVTLPGHHTIHRESTFDVSALYMEVVEVETVFVHITLVLPFIGIQLVTQILTPLNLASILELLEKINLALLGLACLLSWSSQLWDRERERVKGQKSKCFSST